MSIGNTTSLEVNDKCFVRADYGDGTHRGKRVQILKIQKHGRDVYAKVMWCSTMAKHLEKVYGTLFPIEDLTKAPT